MTICFRFQTENPAFRNGIHDIHGYIVLCLHDSVEIILASTFSVQSNLRPRLILWLGDLSSILELCGHGTQKQSQIAQMQYTSNVVLLFVFIFPEIAFVVILLSN